MEYIGLTQEQVDQVIRQGKTNNSKTTSSRSYKDIFRENIFTPFNFLLGGLAIVVGLLGVSPINMLFFIAMLANLLIGIGQEIKAKLTLDKLAITMAPRAIVIRDGQDKNILTSHIVEGDLIKLKRGDQIAVDGQIIASNMLQVNESLLTGEAEPVSKKIKQEVLSGSFVVSGNGIMRATKVGEQAYAAELARKAKQFRRASSELIEATNIILKWIAKAMVIIAPVLIIGQIANGRNDIKQAILHAVAALVGMIPEGLVLLTSTAFMIAIVRLARQRMVVQQLPAVETLARTDYILLDKTGTLTDGTMHCYKIIENEPTSLDTKKVLATMAARDKEAPTNRAISDFIGGKKLFKIDNEVPFDSSRKWSSVTINEHVFILGAPEIILDSKKRALYKDIEKYTKQGSRVLVLVETKDSVTIDSIPVKLDSKVIAIIVIQEKIRETAADTLAYFKKQAVNIKVISGDSVDTVAAIAKKVGLETSSFDARRLPDFSKEPDKFADIIKKHGVFGRVLPEQKQEIVKALQMNGAVVAMTGDGVNDALALKQADLGIAMENGSDATKAVASVVLLDSEFSGLPRLLLEGRRVVANIERVANLFIIKNVYVAILALMTSLFGFVYPFLPAQMTVISTLSIGIPAFFLAFAPNKRIYKPGFLKRVLHFAVPTGAIIAMTMFIGYIWLNQTESSLMIIGTSISMIVMLIGVTVLMILAHPWNIWKLALIASCLGAYIGYLVTPITAKIFSLQFEPRTFYIIAILALVASTLIVYLQRRHKTTI